MSGDTNNPLFGHDSLAEKLDRYSVEPHGEGWAIYRGRSPSRHGYNLGHLSDLAANGKDLPQLIERGLNALAPQIAGGGEVEPAAIVNAFYGPNGPEVSVRVIRPGDFPVVNEPLTEYPLYAATPPATPALDAGAVRSGYVAITTNGTTRIIPADEPVFLIRAQDTIGGAAVRAWATLAEAAGSDFDMCQIARQHAAKMDAWPKKKIADIPPPNKPKKSTEWGPNWVCACGWTNYGIRTRCRNSVCLGERRASTTLEPTPPPASDKPRAANQTGNFGKMRAVDAQKAASDKPAPDELVERLRGLRVHIEALGVGCCTCGAKTFQVDFHDANCKVRNVAEALDNLDVVKDRIEADAAEMERLRIRLEETEKVDNEIIAHNCARATAAEAERDAWRARESETQEALQKIGEEFGVHGGEPRIDGVRRVLGEMRAALSEIANAYTAHGYSDAMDAVQALKDIAKEALK